MTTNKRDDENAKKVIAYLNRYAGRKFKPVESNLKFIRARLNEGYTSEDFAKVIKYKTREWKDNPAMAKYLRPETLFNQTKWQSYINELDENQTGGAVESDPEAIKIKGASLINTNYEENETIENKKAHDDAIKRLEALRSTYQTKPKEKTANKKTFDMDAPFHLGVGDDRKDWDSYRDFVLEMLVRADIKLEQQKQAKNNMLAMLPKEIREKMKQHE